jgi:predicted dehydrogenase
VLDPLKFHLISQEKLMSAPKKQVTAIIAGAGGRGMTYAEFSQEHPDRFKVVGVAEPREWNRQHMATTYHLPAENVYTDWRDLAARPRFADAVIIATQDAMHLEPAIAFAKKGYAILLEKPMAPNEADCQRIVQAVKENDVLFGVCHVMRYTRYTQMLKQVVDSGEIGEVVSVEHLEPVGYWHQAHSFVRGNWRNEKESSSMLLAKSCHDLDWLRYVVGEPCKSLSSFGSLKHFRQSAKPAEAGDAKRCLHCAYEPRCPYSAIKIYIKDRLAQGDTGWPVGVLTPEPTLETVTAALENGPYGRCVYECDNDVVDHQVVNMLFENGKTAVFTMTAFNQAGHRKTRIFGTRGEIYGDGEKIHIFDFLTDQTRVIDTEATSATADGGRAALGGHGGGDYGLMDRFVSAVCNNDPSLILSGPDESLETHRMVFGAERARHENRVVNL